MRKKSPQTRATSWQPRCFVLLVLSILSASCGEKRNNSPPEKKKLQGAAGQGFALTSNPLHIPGHPIIKLVRAQASGTHWVLTEKLASQENSYALDHPRQIRRLKNGKVAEVTLPGEPGTLFITDIAAGPETNQLLVSKVVSSGDRSEITHALVLYSVNDENQAKAESAFLMTVEYPELAQAPRIFAMRYHPPWDTLDVGRLASKGDKVFFVGRETNGVPFFVSLEVADRQFTNIKDGALGPRLSTMRMGMIGGTYDTNQQLSLPYKVHVTWNEDNPVVVLPVHILGVEPILEHFKGANLQAHQNAKGMVHALIIPFNKQLEPQGPILRMFGSGYALIHGVTSIHGEAVVFGQDLRSENHAFWDPVITKSDDSFRKPSTDKAIDVRSIMLAGDRIMIAGSHNWSQNPSGLSVSGGSGYIGSLSENWDGLDVQAIDALPASRTEVRQLFMMDGKVCLAGMTGGPDTHRADGDLSKLTGDGFILCHKEDQQ